MRLLPVLAIPSQALQMNDHDTKQKELKEDEEQAEEEEEDEGTEGG